jgi:hypothetical protein
MPIILVVEARGHYNTPEQESKGSQHSPIAAAGVTQQ